MNRSQIVWRLIFVFFSSWFHLSTSEILISKILKKGSHIVYIRVHTLPDKTSYIKVLMSYELFSYTISFSN
jgi:hypothetical protein